MYAIHHVALSVTNREKSIAFYNKLGFQQALQKVWMNDAEIKGGVFIRDYRVEISLAEFKELL